MIYACAYTFHCTLHTIRLIDKGYGQRDTVCSVSCTRLAVLLLYGLALALHMPVVPFLIDLF